MARKESPELDQLSDVRSPGLTAWPALAEVHPTTRRLLAGWGYRYSVWNLHRFSVAKRNGIVICFLQAARAEMTDGIVEMQDKLITSVHNKARKRYEELLWATEERGPVPSKSSKEWELLFGTIPFQTTSCASIPSIYCRARIAADWWKGAGICGAGADGSPLG